MFEELVCEILKLVGPWDQNLNFLGHVRFEILRDL